MANPFDPAESRTVNIDVAATSARVSIGDSPDSIRVMNDGSATVWIEFGGNTVTAALATSMPVGAGVTEVLRSPNYAGGNLYVAAIAAGATGKIYFTPGNGI